MASTLKCFDMPGMFCSILIVVDLKHWKRIMSDDAIQYGDNRKIINGSCKREVKLIKLFFLKKKQGDTCFKLSRRTGPNFLMLKSHFQLKID